MPTALPSPGSIALGVVAGLAAAFASAVSYLVSRHHGNRAGGGSLRLLVLGHAIMGLACLPVCGWLAPAEWPASRGWFGPLAGSVGCYLAGQSAVFAALKRAAASRIAPLLGLKLVMLAAIVTVMPGSGLDGRQWLAVAVSIASAGMLQRGGAVPPIPLAAVGVACLGFAISDLCIVALIDALQPSRLATGGALARLHAGCLAMAVTYVACGMVAAVILAVAPALRPRDRRDAIAAVQYAAAWLGGMVALYACFGLVGVVFGNVLQATRGVMAIAVGAVLAWAGWHDLEEPVDRATLLRRLAAAGLMVLAILLYVADVI
ncbi:MAG: EamA family transporter [Planctomycetota bacterium]